MLVDEKDRGPKCSRCKKITIKLLSLTDDGEGRRICKDCKREIRKKFPDKDYRKVS